MAMEGLTGNGEGTETTEGVEDDIVRIGELSNEPDSGGWALLVATMLFWVAGFGEGVLTPFRFSFSFGEPEDWFPGDLDSSAIHEKVGAAIDDCGFPMVVQIGAHDIINAWLFQISCHGH